MGEAGVYIVLIVPQHKNQYIKQFLPITVIKNFNNP